MRLKWTQVILIVGACLAYAGFLVSFVNTNSIFTLACGAVMGILFLLALMFGLPKDGEDSLVFDEDGYEEEGFTEEGDKAPHEKVHVNSLIDQLAERREDLEDAKGQLAQKDEEIQSLNKKVEDSRMEVTELQQQKQFLEERVAALEQSLKEAGSRSASAGSTDAIESILPDITNDPPMVLNIGEAANNVAGDFKAAAEKAGISIRTVSTDATLMVKASPIMIEVLFKNIIDNAIKYMKNEGTLQITISRIEQELFIVMKDNGAGLSEDETQHIFELNYQGTNRISGNGLGLAQARAIVEYYGGMIYARSSVGNGMGIYIHLPSAL